MKKNVLAIDFGATNLRFAIVNSEGEIIKKVLMKTEADSEARTDFTRKIIDEVRKFLSETENFSVSGIGIAVAGPVDIENGSFTPPNLGMEKIYLGDPLRKAFGLPVFFNNDCNAAILGESVFGKHKNRKNIVYITISSGIGSGVIIDGKLAEGSRGNVGEVGHFVIENQYDLPCGCGSGLGHWEAYSSGKNIPKFFSVWSKKNGIECEFDFSSAENIFSKASEGNKTAIKFIEDLGKINGRGVTNVIRAFDPEIILFDGSVVRNNEELVLKQLMKYIDNIGNIPKTELASLGGDAPLLGAAAAFFVSKQ